jgi:hypothetical protein
MRVMDDGDVIRSVVLKTLDRPFAREKGDSMDLEKIMDSLSRELSVSLKAMAKASDLNDKEIHSRIVKNLCKSLSVFFDLAGEMMPLDFDDDADEEDIHF